MQPASSLASPSPAQLGPVQAASGSQEIQLIGDRTVKYVFGGLYYQERARGQRQAFNTNVFLDAAGTAYAILSLDYAKQRIDRASRVKTTSRRLRSGHLDPENSRRRPAHHSGRTLDQGPKGWTVVRVNQPLLLVNGRYQARIVSNAWWRSIP